MIGADELIGVREKTQRKLKALTLNLAELQARMLAIQFNSRRDVPLETLSKGLALHNLTETFADAMTVVDGGRRVELIWAPSEAGIRIRPRVSIWSRNSR